MAFFSIAALALIALIALHVTVGHNEVARPLLNSSAFKTDVIYALYLCWHLLTLLMIASVGAYVLAAGFPAHKEFALAATIMLCLFALWSLSVTIWKRQRHRDLPQWIAFAAVAMLGLAGHLTS